MALLRCCCRCSAVDFVPNFIFTILFAHSWLENLHKIELALYLNASMWLRWGPHLTFFASFKVRILNFFQCEEWGEDLNFFVRLRKNHSSLFLNSNAQIPKKAHFSFTLGRLFSNFGYQKIFIVFKWEVTQIL